MAQLIVRNIEADVVQELRLEAAKEGVSMEEKHRRILREALNPRASRPQMNFKEFLLTMPDVGDDSVFERVRSQRRKLPF